MNATVRPEKLRQVLASKLSDATWAWLELHETEKPQVTGNLTAADAVSHLVTAARGVYQTAETFAKFHPAIGRPSFDRWYQQWLQHLSADQRRLWDSLTDDRDAQIHGEGAALVDIEIDVTVGVEIGNNIALYAAAGLPPQKSRAWKTGKRFAVDPDRPASVVGKEYIDLAQRFADDFMRAHAAQIPG